MKKYLSILAVTAFAVATVSIGIARGAVTTNPITPWVFGSNGLVKTLLSSSSVQVPSLANLNCIGTNASGTFQSGTCSGGGGGGGTTTTINGVSGPTFTFSATSSGNTLAYSTSTANVILTIPQNVGFFTNNAGYITLNSLSATTPLSYSTSTGALSISLASSTSNGYLSSTDWSTFNGKQAAGNYLTALTGDGSASGPGSAAFTLATVNANVGTFGSSSVIPSFTVNGKGLITGVTTSSFSAITSLNGLTTSTQTFATSSDTNLGLSIVSSGSTHTFTPSWIGTLGVTRGGTGLNALSQGDIIYGSAANTFSALAKDTNATRYLSNTGSSNNPAWAQINLANGITGTLSPANGGTGVANNALSTLTVSGSFPTTLTVSATTSVTLPTSGTLATLAGSETFTNKTLTNPTVNAATITGNVTSTASYDLDGTPNTDDTYTGNASRSFNAGATVAQWESVYLDSSSTWQLTDADAAATSSGMIGLATEAGTAANPMKTLLPGSFARNDAWNWTPGGTLYLSTTAGALTQTQPSGTDDVIRVVGWAVNADVIFWSPSEDYITHT